MTIKRLLNVHFLSVTLKDFGSLADFVDCPDAAFACTSGLKALRNEIRGESFVSLSMGSNVQIIEIFHHCILFVKKLKKIKEGLR